MGTFFGFIAIVLFVYLLIYLFIILPIRLIKWSVYGGGFLFPDFNKIDEKVNKNSSNYVNLKGFQGKIKYYFLVFWTFSEIAIIMYLIQ